MTLFIIPLRKVGMLIACLIYIAILNAILISFNHKLRREVNEVE
mgnify:CR=1 FL=1|tara:strand:+ start:145 stop:276 length:132 start_codon:yes stop_codon:yes gene_type:complete